MSEVSPKNSYVLDPTWQEYYEDWEVTRGSGVINGDFMVFDGGPITRGLEVVRSSGKLALLDAGCGSGNGIIDFKEQVVFRAPVEPEAVTALGIDRHDYTHLLPGWERPLKVQEGYVDLRLGELDEVQIEPSSIDIACSYETLHHNDDPAPIVSNILSALKNDGAFYFNIRPEQAGKLVELLNGLVLADWDVQSKLLTRVEGGRLDSRIAYRVVKPAPKGL